MAREVNTRAQGSAESNRPADTRLYLRDEELDRGVGLIFAGQRTLSAAGEPARRAAGLSRGELEVLMAIRHGGGLDVSALRDGLGATTPTLARILAGLDRRGFIARTPDRDDRRRRRLWLSPAGEQAVAPVVEAMRAALRKAYRDAGPGQVSGARAMLEALTR
jgi:DNA-binding MarR family transcriptional regulator